MSALLESQFKFSQMVSRLIDHIYVTGYTVSFGEAWRTPEQAELNAKTGKGIKNSLHCDRLAVDLNIFKEGNLIPTPEPIGQWWESIGGSWGGRFNDPGHFSLAFGGRK